MEVVKALIRENSVIPLGQWQVEIDDNEVGWRGIFNRERQAGNKGKNTWSDLKTFLFQKIFRKILRKFCIMTFDIYRERGWAPMDPSQFVNIFLFYVFFYFCTHKLYGITYTLFILLNLIQPTISANPQHDILILEAV